MRHCEEPTGPARSGRPDDKLRDEAIQRCGAGLDCFASLAMTRNYLIDRSSALTILPHLSTSALNMASACAGAPVIGSKPMSVSFFCTSGVCTMALTAPLRVASTCGSVLAGAKKPTQDAAVKPAKPCSA